MNAVLDHAPRIISTQPGLQWLVKRDEITPGGVTR